MPQTLRLLIRAVGGIIGFYFVLWLIASVWVGGRVDTIDTVRSLNDIYKSDAREFVYRLPAFCEQAKHQRNLIFVGGSTAYAYDPAVIGPYVKGWAVSRIGLDFANITQMRQTVDMIRACMDSETFARSRFVLGVSYPSMAKNSNRFPTPYTMLELEQQRHGLFTGKPGALRPTVPWKDMRWTIIAARPVILAHYVVTGVSDFFGAARLRLGKFRQGAGHVEDSQAHREANELRFNDALIGAAPAPAFEEQGRDFAALVNEIRAGGSDVAVISVPEQTFVRQRQKFIGAYYAWLGAFATAHKLTLLHHPYTDADFRDGVHANAAGTARWSAAIAPAVVATLPPAGR
ncbi:hypothetical protein QH494_26595 [Sphingomonas sp. AR_OL41]|uniref:hypothetical protein n=1 Tax=Sphingomonas sp. AR_OL41 TaxID=3042729 RepID=UPI00248016EF|nr:hypothetical protein [Sphingomonas sp. AR_OL41]MDH7975769.1 hypothetical protein [Sphingomonas sp. AR_OL41]